MTAKDYIKIAKVFKNLGELKFQNKIEYEVYLIHSLCDLFEADNPRFKRDKFKVACGLQDLSYLEDKKDG